MRIAFFSDSLASRYGFGVGRYAWELFHALREIRPAFDLLPVSTRSNLDREALTRMQEQYGHRLLPWRRRWTALSWALFGRPCIEHWLGQSIDCVHHLELSYPIGTNKPWVVTIHDIGPLTHPEFFSGGRPWLVRAALHQAVDQARVLICVSQATAREVQDFVSTSIEDRVFVVSEGVSSIFLEKEDGSSLDSLKDQLRGSAPFILAGGSINPRKNLSRVVEALEMVANRVPHHLVLFGARGWDSDRAWQRIQNSPVAERIHFLGFVTDQQLNALYHQAELFVYPSLFEGFGLPVIEAMACGCPVVTSNVSSLPEAAGDAALVVNPTDATALAEAILRIVQDGNLANELASRGKVHAASFTWNRGAEQIAAIYESIV